VNINSYAQENIQSTVIRFNLTDIGVVANNRVQFYQFSDSWRRIPYADIPLPNGYTQVIGGLGNQIGIIINNSIQIYELANGFWVNMPNKDMSLPREYKHVFGIVGRIGIVANGRIQFYEWLDDSWNIISDADLLLSSNYSHVFGTGVFFGDVGVVVDGRVQFHAFDFRQWRIRDDYLLLPEGYSQVFGFVDARSDHYLGVGVNNTIHFFLVFLGKKYMV